MTLLTFMDGGIKNGTIRKKYELYVYDLPIY